MGPPIQQDLPGAPDLRVPDSEEHSAASWGAGTPLCGGAKAPAPSVEGMNERTEHLDPTTGRRRAVWPLALAAAATLGLAGCAPSAPLTAPTAPAGDASSSDRTSGAEAGSSTSGGSADGSQGGSGIASGEPAPTENCGVDPDDPRIAEAVAQVPSPYSNPAAHGNEDVRWSTSISDTSYDPCAELSYALLDIEGATGSSPTQVMLFHFGEYIGTTSD